MLTASLLTAKGYPLSKARTATRMFSALLPGSRRRPAVAFSDTGVVACRGGGGESMQGP